MKSTRLRTGETQYAQALDRRIAGTLLNKYTNKEHNNFTSIATTSCSNFSDSTRTYILNIASMTMLVMVVLLILCIKT